MVSIFEDCVKDQMRLRRETCNKLSSKNGSLYWNACVYNANDLYTQLVEQLRVNLKNV